MRRIICNIVGVFTIIIAIIMVIYLPSVGNYHSFTLSENAVVNEWEYFKYLSSPKNLFLPAIVPEVRTPSARLQKLWEIPDIPQFANSLEETARLFEALTAVCEEFGENDVIFKEGDSTWKYEFNKEIYHRRYGEELDYISHTFSLGVVELYNTNCYLRTYLLSHHGAITDFRKLKVNSVEISDSSDYYDFSNKINPILRRCLVVSTIAAIILTC